MAEPPYSPIYFWQDLDNLNSAAPERYFSVNCKLYKIRNYEMAEAENGGL